MADQPFAGDRSTERLYRAAMGDALANRYLRVFERFDDRGVAGPTWNRAAAFFHLGWLIHHRLWKALAVWLALVAVLALIVIGVWRFALDWPIGVKLGGSLAVALVACLVPGLWGSAWLHEGLRQRMIEAVRREASLSAACAALSAATQRRQRQNTWALAGFLGTGTLVALLGVMVPWGSLRGPEAPAGPKLLELVEAPVSPPAVAGARGDETGHSELASAVKPAVADTSGPQGERREGSTEGGEAARALPSKLSEEPIDGLPSLEEVDTPGAAADRIGPLGADHADEGLPKLVHAVASSASSPSASTTHTYDESGLGLAVLEELVAEKQAVAVNESGAQPGPTDRTGVRPMAESFGVAVGMFAVKANAERVVGKLRGVGLPVVSDAVTTSRGELTRVRVGPFQRREQAREAAAKVLALGLDAKVLPP